jgi:hypothetical protein
MVHHRFSTLKLHNFDDLALSITECDYYCHKSSKFNHINEKCLRIDSV